jgi:hypothetical protein
MELAVRAPCPSVIHEGHARDILDSDARQRAEIRKLRKALHEFVDLRWRKEVCTDREWVAIRALAPKRKAKR